MDQPTDRVGHIIARKTDKKKRLSDSNSINNNVTSQSFTTSVTHSYHVIPTSVTTSYLHLRRHYFVSHNVITSSVTTSFLRLLQHQSFICYIIPPSIRISSLHKLPIHPSVSYKFILQPCSSFLNQFWHHSSIKHNVIPLRNYGIPHSISHFFLR